MRLPVPLGLALVPLLLAASGPTAKISAEYDRATDFARYETYVWKEGTPARRPQLQKSIEGFVERELERCGLSPSRGAPDAWVQLYVLVDEHSLQQLHDTSYWEFYAGLRDVDAYELEAGTLVVDVVDAQTEKVVWRGLITGAVRESIDVIERKLDKAIRKLFKRYPGG